MHYMAILTNEEESFLIMCGIHSTVPTPFYCDGEIESMPIEGTMADEKEKDYYNL